jgi:hypothetical protein
MDAVGTPDRCDVVRRRKLSALHSLTGRNTIIYATDFMGDKARLANVSIDLTDKEGFIEVTKNLTGDQLDVVLQSPGGQEAAESIVTILRAKFSNIRFIIPNVAKSAATMLAMSGNLLVMDERSELGPTDPQMLVNRDGQRIVAPAHAIKDQFKLASKEIATDPQRLTPWLPILRQYGPSLLSECDRSLNLSNKLVAAWLKKYMFSGVPRAAAKATRVAKYLTSKVQFQSHARRIGIDDLQSRGVRILDLRTNSTLQNAVWELNIVINLTFAMTAAYKIFENNKNEALIRQLQLLAPTQGNPTP